MRKILLLTLLLNNYAFAQAVFPNSEKKCVTVKKICSYDSSVTCIYTYCGNEINQLTLENWIANNNIIGKHFDSIIAIEDFFKKNLPKDLVKLQVRIIGEGLTTMEYNAQRITVIVTKNNYITTVKIG